MDDRLTDDWRRRLAWLVEAATRPARLALLLDDRQPDRLRVEALTMPAERLCWTLTQLDAGLDLSICQALVRASRLSRRRPPRPDQAAAECWSAETAATVAQAWAVRRLAALPAAAEIVHWLTAAGPLVCPAVGDMTPVGAPTAPSWLDLPPIVGPPPGAFPSAGPVERFVEWLAGVWPGR